MFLYGILGIICFLRTLEGAPLVVDSFSSRKLFKPANYYENDGSVWYPVDGSEPPNISQKDIERAVLQKLYEVYPDIFKRHNANSPLFDELLQAKIPEITSPSSEFSINSNEIPDQSDKTLSSIEESKILPESTNSVTDRPGAIVIDYDLEDNDKENESMFVLENNTTEINNVDDKNTATISDDMVPDDSFFDETDVLFSGIAEYDIPAKTEKTGSTFRFDDDYDNELTVKINL